MRVSTETLLLSQGTDHQMVNPIGMSWDNTEGGKLISFSVMFLCCLSLLHDFIPQESIGCRE